MVQISNSTKPYIIFPLMALLSLWGCEKVNNTLAFDETPVIRLVEISQNTIVQFQESITVTLEYEDGDGDLGNPDPDINSIFVKDSRLAKADEYYLGPLAPVDAEVSIQGRLQVQLSSTFLLGNGTEEKVIYSIYVVDRGGRQSNTVETEEITILRE